MYLEPPSKFFVKKKARELSSARPLQELNEDLPQRTLHFVSSLLELLVSDEMGLVVVSLELLQQRLEFGLVEVLVNLGVEKGLHLIKISGVKPWGQKGFFDVGRFGSFLAAGAFFAGGEVVEDDDDILTVVNLAHRGGLLLSFGLLVLNLEIGFTRAISAAIFVFLSLSSKFGMIRGWIYSTLTVD